MNLEIDIHSGYLRDFYKRIYLLNYFPHLKANIYKYPRTSFANYFFKIGLYCLRILSRYLPIKLKVVIEEDISKSYQRDIHYGNYRSWHYFIGYWASPFYYKDIESELKYELTPPIPENGRALEMLEKIKSVNSCSIHYRSYDEELGNQRFSMAHYYKNAIALMRDKYSDIRFFVFSDNIERAKLELSDIDLNFIFVDIPEAKGNSQSLIDFYLMYSCENSIIGDSTFSWWAAWLSDNGKKWVIAPRGLSPWGDDWLPESWIKVNCSFV
jgi:hypothetical protein